MITLLTRWLWPSRPKPEQDNFLDKGWQADVLALHIEQASAGTRRPWVWRGWDG